jgi:hypothetical protein
MSIKPLLAALSLAGFASLASATVTQDNGPYTLSYDETTSFGYLAGWFSSNPTHGFSWAVPTSAQLASLGSTASATVNLPDFTVTTNAGWALSNATGFLGNIVFTEVDGATTNIRLYADVSVNGGPAVSINGDALDRVITGNGPSYVQGYFAQTASLPGGFSSLSVSNASIVLSVSGGVFSSIAAQPQNKLEISFAVAQVPEPETAAMLLAGLAAVGLLAKRRGRQG